MALKRFPLQWINPRFKIYNKFDTIDHGTGKI